MNTLKEWLLDNNLPYLNLPKENTDMLVYNIEPNIQILTDLSGKLLAAFEIQK